MSVLNLKMCIGTKLICCPNKLYFYLYKISYPKIINQDFIYKRSQVFRMFGSITNFTTKLSKIID